MKIRKGIAYFSGLLTLALGITLTILANLGTGAWDALHVGLATITPLTVGNWVILVGAMLVVINALLVREKPNFLSLGTAIILGYFIDFWLILVFPHVVIEQTLVQYLLLLLGIFLMALGISVYLQSKFPVIPIDGFMFAIQKVLKCTLMIAKTTIELIALLLALVVGGPIGIGTLLITFSIGPLIQLFYPRINKIMMPNGGVTTD